MIPRLFPRSHAPGIRRIACACLLALLAACVPAKTPSQLGATPAAPFVVNGDRYDARAFRVDFPAGWRVITSAAGSPASVILASPDNCTLIAVSVESVDAPEPSGCDANGFQRESRAVMIPGATIHAALIAPASGWDAALAIFERLATSIQAGGAEG